jgi:hypothetical protein
MGRKSPSAGHEASNKASNELAIRQNNAREKIMKILFGAMRRPPSLWPVCYRQSDSLSHPLVIKMTAILNLGFPGSHLHSLNSTTKTAA